jgi:hypothetical protein
LSKKEALEGKLIIKYLGEAHLTQQVKQASKREIFSRVSTSHQHQHNIEIESERKNLSLSLIFCQPSLDNSSS